MATEARQINELIRNICSREDTRSLFFPGEVKKVYDVYCDIEVLGMTITQVPLCANPKPIVGQLIIKPKEGSIVLLADRSGGGMSTLSIIAYSAIESIEFDAANIIINGGENSGLIKIDALTKQLNDLCDWCKGHKHPDVIVSVTGGGGSPAVGVIGNSGAPVVEPPKFNKDDYENTAIKH